MKALSVIESSRLCRPVENRDRFFCRQSGKVVLPFRMLHPDFVFPAYDRLSLAASKLFTWVTAIGTFKKLALSFCRMKDVPAKRIVVIPLLLRKEALEAEPFAGDYLHGYLLNSGFGEEVERWRRLHPDIPLHFFWDKKGVGEKTEVDDRLCFHALNDTLFIRYLAGAKAYATTAGFESICEAMYLNKPVLMVPTHVEQACYAFDAVRVGVA